VSGLGFEGAAAIAAPEPARERRPRGLARGPLRVLFDERVRRIVLQVVFLLIVVGVVLYLRDNYLSNIEDQNISTSWDYLDQPTEFNIADSDFRATQPVKDAILVGVKNTFLAALVGIVLATVVGVIVGVLRLSSNWLVRKAATLYVETLRNVPVLLIILFTNAVVATLPRIRDAVDVGGLLVVSNRSSAVASPVAGDNLGVYAAVLAVAVVVALAVASWRTRVANATGTPHHRVLWAGGIVVAVAIVGYVVLDDPITLSRPELAQTGRRIVGGATMGSPYFALVVALAAYTASHIAEIVRGSIQAVPRGQTEASTALGLGELHRLRYVVLPQALRIAIPPTINQYLSLTKNTSLGLAIAYAEITLITQQLIATRSPALQSIVVLMLVYLVFSLSTSVLLNVVNRRFQLVER
jgi:general L-amino acid transport system permease protein